MKKTVLITPSERALKAIKDAISCGRDMVLIELGQKRRTVSRERAKKLVGAAYLNVWEKAGLIKGVKRGSGDTCKTEYDLTELHRLQLSDTYCYFLD